MFFEQLVCFPVPLPPRRDVECVGNDAHGRQARVHLDVSILQVIERLNFYYEYTQAENYGPCFGDGS
jgi:hypothetical protein